MSFFTLRLWRRRQTCRYFFLPSSGSIEQEQLPAYKLVNALKRCCSTRDLELGERIHQNAKDSGFESAIFVASTLVNMYSKCGEIQRASQVFQEMSSKNVVTWTCLMLGHVENKKNARALELFHTMDCEPDAITCVAALKALAGLAGERDSNKEAILEEGMVIHERIKAKGLHSNVTLASVLVELYSKCRVMGLARDVFEQMPHKDVVTWTSLVLGYVDNGESFIALELFDNMDCQPDVVTYVAAVKACIRLPTSEMILQKGERIHERIRKHGFDRNKILSNSLLEMYIRCRELNLARDIFERMTNKDVVTWTCLILGYVENGEHSIAFEMFNNMDCEPDEFTYTAVLKACTSLEMGKTMHNKIKEKNFEFDTVLSNALIEMYGRCGDTKLAREAFEEMDRKNVVSYTCLMIGYVENGDSFKALEVFHSMGCEPDELCYVAAFKACVALAGERGTERKIVEDTGLSLHEKLKEKGLESNVVVASGLMDFYRKLGDMQRATESFERIPVKDVVVWNSLIQGYAENGNSMAALDVFISRMDCQPNHVTYILVLKACSSLVAVPFGRLVHGTICRHGLEQEASVATTLINFYGKCGCMATAAQVFHSMISPGIVSWSALLAGYSSLGDSHRVFGLVNDILEAGLHLDGVTFVCILTACSHAGMVEEGERYFHSMHKYGLKPSVEHYTCLIDMLGRVNKLEHVVSIIESMPFEVDHVTWMSVLDACKKWNNLEVGKVAFDALVTSRTGSNGAPFALMRDICTMA